MQFGLKSLLAIPLSLMLISTASAAFTYSLSNDAVNGDLNGDSGTISLFATADGTPGTQFLTILDIDFDITTDAAGITTTFTAGGSSLFFSPNTTQSIGTISWTIAPGTEYLASEEFDINILALGGTTNPPPDDASGSVSGSVTAVPEPSSLALATLCLAGMVGFRRRS